VIIPLLNRTGEIDIQIGCCLGDKGYQPYYEVQQLEEKKPFILNAAHFSKKEQSYFTNLLKKKAKSHIKNTDQLLKQQNWKKVFTMKDDEYKEKDTLEKFA